MDIEFKRIDNITVINFSFRPAPAILALAVLTLLKMLGGI